MERITKIAESAARRYIVSKISKYDVEDIDVTVEIEANDGLVVNVEINIDTVSDKDDCRELAREGVEAAHRAVDDELKRIMRNALENAT